MDQPAAKVVTISIDANFELSRFDRATQYTLTSRLASLLETHHIPATWAFSDPAKSVALDRIIGKPGDHEIGVLGDSAWIAPRMERSRLLAELMPRFGAARAMGISVTTLALSDVSLHRELDLLVTNGIRIIRPPVARTFGKSMPCKLQCGIWQIPANVVWPTANDAALGQAKHVVIDMASLGKSAKPWKQLSRYLKDLAKRRDHGSLVAETLSQLGERLTQQTPSGGSILRKAA